MSHQNPEFAYTNEAFPLMSLHDDLVYELQDADEAKDLLRPYMDPVYFLSRISGKSRLFRNAPHIDDETIKALRTGDSDDISQVLDSLCEARQNFALKNNPVGTLLSVLTTAKHIEHLRDKAIPVDDENRENALMTLNTLFMMDLRATCNEIPTDQLRVTYQVSWFMQSMLAKYAELSNNNDLLIASGTIDYVSNFIKNRYITSEYIKRLPGEDATPTTPEQVSQDNATISELFKDIQQTRQFGMKMGYIADSRGGSLVFNSIAGLEFLPELELQPMLTSFNKKTAALVVHSEKTNFKNIKVKTIEHGDLNHVKTSMIDLRMLRPINDLHLGKDGELYNDATCDDPMVNMAVELNKYSAYRDLQATILAHYFDLTHPIEQVAVIKNREKTGRSNTERTTTDPTELISKLVIPRIHYRHDEEDSSEDNTQEKPDTDDEPRSVRLHNVVWHIRKLPEGWQASPEAQQTAKQIGITLGDRETIVKEHQRGSRLLGEVVGHKLIHRS